MVFIFLTPQPNDYSNMLKVNVQSDIISTLREIAKGDTVATYQTCLKSLLTTASFVNGNVRVILSNGEMMEVAEETTLEDIIEKEKEAIKDTFNTPKSELKAHTNINEIKVNAMDFYQANYYEENKDKIEDDVVEAIVKSREKNEPKDVWNELGIIYKIITSYKIQGKICNIESDGQTLEESKFFTTINKIVLDGFEPPRGTTKRSDTANFNYTITFDSGTKIIRNGLEFSILE